MNITDVLNAETGTMTVPTFSETATYSLDESEVYQKFRLIANAIFSVEESDFATQDQKDFVAKLDLPLLAKFKNTRYYRGLRALATDGFKLSVLMDKTMKTKADKKACFTLKYGVLPGEETFSATIKTGFAVKPYKANQGSVEYKTIVAPEVSKQNLVEKRIDNIVANAKRDSTNLEEVQAALKTLVRPAASEAFSTTKLYTTTANGSVSKKLN